MTLLLFCYTIDSKNIYVDILQVGLSLFPLVQTKMDKCHQRLLRGRGIDLFLI